LLIETHPLTIALLIDPTSAVFDVHENVVAASVGPDKAESATVSSFPARIEKKYCGM
jgi:hypothetical protein